MSTLFVACHKGYETSKPFTIFTVMRDNRSILRLMTQAFLLAENSTTTFSTFNVHLELIENEVVI